MTDLEPADRHSQIYDELMESDVGGGPLAATGVADVAADRILDLERRIASLRSVVSDLASSEAPLPRALEQVRERARTVLFQTDVRF